MSQAISNKVLVRSGKYCWMICDYTTSGTTLNYSLSFYFEGGCAQLDNAWIKVGSTTVWSNTGRVHNYNSGQPWNKSHTVSIHSGTATISGSQTVSFGVTKYSGVAVSGSFVVSGGSAPTGLAVDLLGFTDTTVRLKGHVNSYGSPASANGRYIEVSVLGSSTYGPPYRYMTESNVNDIDIIVDNNSRTWGEDICNITGNTTYHYGAYANNTSLSSSMIAPATFVTLPAYIIDLNAVHTGGGIMNVATVHGTEGNALTVYTEYSWDGENWITVSDPFNVTITEPKTIYVRRFSDAGETPVFSKLLVPNNGKAFYGSVNNLSKSLNPVYATFGNYFDSRHVLTGRESYVSTDVFGDQITATKVSSGSSGYNWVAYPIDATDELINKQVILSGEFTTSGNFTSGPRLWWLNSANTNILSGPVAGIEYIGNSGKFSVSGTIPSRPSNAGKLALLLYSNIASAAQGVYTVYNNVELKANVKNISNPTSVSASVTTNGITATYNATTQTFTFNGTCTKNNTCFTCSKLLNLEAGKYSLSFFVKGGSLSNITGATKIQYQNSNGWANTILVPLGNTSASNSVTIPARPSNVNNVRFDNGVVANNYQIQIQLERGNATGSFAPFVDTKTHKLKKIYGSVKGRAKLIYDEGAQ